MFYFDFRNYFTMVGLAWSERSGRARAYQLLVLCLAVPIVSTFHALCFALDNVLFPGLRHVEVRRPIFMVGHARSGTTLTHRLLMEDAERFSCFRLYELFFPSLLQKKLIRAAARADARLLGGFLERRVRDFETWRYGAMRHVHEMGLTKPEEDDIVLYYSMAAGFWTTKVPCLGEIDFYHMQDWPERRRRRVNQFYRDCVRRQLYLNGPDRIHLSKNPGYSGRVASLIEAFPDARIIVNVRNPHETIPSLLKLVRGSWKRLGWDEARQRRSLEVLAAQSWHTYRHPLEVLDAHPEIRGAVVDYRELVEDPAGTVERIYRELDLPMTSAYRETLSREAKRARAHATRHRYSLEEFGLDEDAIRTELADLFERFGWESTEPAGGA